MRKVGVTAAQPTPEWRSLSKDPGHAPELAVLNTLPLLSPRVTQWQAEILVFQRRHQTVAEAEAALHSAGNAKSRDRGPPWARRTWMAVKQLPQMIGLQLRRIKRPLDVVIWAAEAAAFFVPLMSIPVWTYANAVSTKRLGRAAMEHYRPTSAGADPTTTIVLARPPTARVRRRLVVSLVGLIVALAILAPFTPLGKVSHSLPLGGIVLAEIGLLWTGLRLALITRPSSTRRPKLAPTSHGDP
jgi:hypothetical protein